MVKGPKWKAAFYLDEHSNREQAEALRKIFTGEAGGFLATVASFIEKSLGVRTARIEFATQGKKREVKVPDVLVLSAEGVSGANPDRESLVTNPALYGASGFDPIIAVSTKYAYNDHGFHWDNSGKNSFYSRFSYSP